MNTTNIKHIRYLGRDAVVLSNEKVQAVIDFLGGMVPEFSIRRGNGAVNPHWIPQFRMNFNTEWSTELHAEYWKGKLLSAIAGDFPCAPNFGPECSVDGVSIPAHGWTAQELWNLDDSGIIDEGETAYARFSLQSPDARMPLSFQKMDIVRRGHTAYYSAITVTNKGAFPVEINIARHNTLGSPFLEAGCRISMSATHFAVAPSGTEFDSTGRLVQGALFENLREAPCRDGGTADLSTVPGMIGYTDLITGPVPVNSDIGWICVVNPVLSLAYLSFFPGPANLKADEIGLSFNDLWMQYGGRHFTPWALYDGGFDRTLCLGTENARGAFANGLAYSRLHPELLGSPTLATIPARGSRTLYYGTALIELDEAQSAEGIDSVEAEHEAIVLKSSHASQRIALDGNFSALRLLARRIDS